MSVAVYEVHDGVAALTLNRAEARNALNSELRSAIRDGFASFAHDASAQVMVMAAAGSTFCAGGDLAEMSALGTTVIPPNFVPSITEFPDCHKPVIAAVQGPALGGGFWLVQNCDLVVAADDAQFGITEAKWGRGAPWATPLFSLIGARHALELMVTAEPIDAYRAHEIGLVNHVVPVAELPKRTQELARRVAGLAPLSIRTSVQMIRSHRAQVSGDLAANAWQMWRPVYESDDAQEGPRAFTEKRRPQWQGK